MAERASFDVASAGAFPGSDYDLVCFFDCLHDMGDPVGALQHTRRALGAQAGAARLTHVANEAGFTRVRTAASTPFNIVLELRP